MPARIRNQFYNSVADRAGFVVILVLELDMRDTISTAIEKMHILKVLGAPIRDPHKTSGVPLADQYVGLLDFASLVLWALEVLWLNFNFFYSFSFSSEAHLIS